MNKIQHHYDKMADIYDRQYDDGRGRAYYSHLCDYILGAVPPGGDLLDLGCGTGLFMRRYLGTGGTASGLDISRGMIIRAQSRCPGSMVTVGDAEKLPFRDETFDAITSVLAFSYLRDPESMLRESFRVLRPGGTIAIITLGKNVMTALVPVIYRVGEVLKIRRVGMAYFGEHYYDEEEISELFHRIGYVDVQVQRRSVAHVNTGDLVFDLTKKVEPIVEHRLPKLAYNICVSGKKPER
ncbi:MAG: class I SAM-dependent methyltransferase [Methanomicrobiaceae archaeon]|nr:class I SAM-dependent methyltransferase [Methanomicrobiaceae archaeon]